MSYYWRLIRCFGLVNKYLQTMEGVEPSDSFRKVQLVCVMFHYDF